MTVPWWAKKQDQTHRCGWRSRGRLLHSQSAAGFSERSHI